MASNGRTLKDLADGLGARSKTLVNADLKKICKEEGEIQSGNKSQLQARVMGIVQRYVDSNDVDSLQRLRYRVANHGNAPPPGYIQPPAAPPSYPTPAASAAPTAYDMPLYPVPQVALPARSQVATNPIIKTFKDSPFYDIEAHLLSRPLPLEPSPSHRQSREAEIVLSNPHITNLKADSSFRVLLFASVEQPLSLYQKADISFPSQIEVRVNQEEVKSNYKGLKNKPGSTRPADITPFVRKYPDFRNKLTITYALTQKRFNVFVFLAKKHSVEELTNRIKQRSVITKTTVINDMLKKADDPDIVLDSTVMSLKDPISTLRINVPCRSHLCNHNQCFDAESFLQLQEQAPTWQCPVCNKTVSFEGLAVDQYVQEILDSVPRDTDQVTIEPNGNWVRGNKSDSQTPRNGKTTQDPGSDDDLIEITDYRVTNIKSEAMNSPLSTTRTPPLSSRDSSTAPRTGNKRKSEVIDLTLSDDDEPARPAKKVAYNTPNSLPDSSFRNRMPTFGTPAPISTQPPPALLQPQYQPQLNPGLPGVRLDLRPLNTPAATPYPSYRPPPPRPTYQPGSGAYNNLGSS
jgi:E3 SUMO-protein ligase PIAS1